MPSGNPPVKEFQSYEEGFVFRPESDENFRVMPLVEGTADRFEAAIGADLPCGFRPKRSVNTPNSSILTNSRKTEKKGKSYDKATNNPNLC